MIDAFQQKPGVRMLASDRRESRKQQGDILVVGHRADMQEDKVLRKPRSRAKRRAGIGSRRLINARIHAVRHDTDPLRRGARLNQPIARPI